MKFKKIFYYLTCQFILIFAFFLWIAEDNANCNTSTTGQVEVTWMKGINSTITFDAFMDQKMTVKPEVKPEVSSVAAFLQEQERRKEKITQVCRIGLQGGASYEPLVVDEPDKLILCYIYKSASSSLVKLLSEIRGINTTITEQNALRKHFSMAKVNSITVKKYKNFTKFVAVRNPLDRLLSAYRNKFENASKKWYYDHYGKKMVGLYRRDAPETAKKDVSRTLNKVLRRMEMNDTLTGDEGNALQNPVVGPTFQEFVKYVIKFPYKDPHWFTYRGHCKVCEMEYDFILKFENLNLEVDVLLEYLNKSHLKLNTVNSNPDDKTRAKLCSYWSTISEKDLSSLIKLYAVDFLMFEYSSQFHVNCLREKHL